MDTKARMTKQGVRDLNRYGPKLGKSEPPRPAEPDVADESGAAEKKSDGNANPAGAPKLTAAVGISTSALVVGCAEQLPNQLRAYHLMGTASDGAMLLSRHGATYSAKAGEVCAYPELLDRLLALVLRNFPSSLRGPGREALITRWNRDWGIEPEDLEDLDDQRSVQATTNASSHADKSSRTSSSPFARLQREVGARRMSAPAAVH